MNIHRYPTDIPLISLDITCQSPVSVVKIPYVSPISPESVGSMAQDDVCGFRSSLTTLGIESREQLETKLGEMGWDHPKMRIPPYFPNKKMGFAGSYRSLQLIDDS